MNCNMDYEIGGLKASLYLSLLTPVKPDNYNELSKVQKLRVNVNQAMEHVVLLIKRIAYWIFNHHFPSNGYLLNCFNSHDFHNIEQTKGLPTVLHVCEAFYKRNLEIKPITIDDIDFNQLAPLERKESSKILEPPKILESPEKSEGSSRGSKVQEKTEPSKRLGVRKKRYTMTITTSPKKPNENKLNGTKKKSEIPEMKPELKNGGKSSVDWKLIKYQSLVTELKKHMRDYINSNSLLFVNKEWEALLNVIYDEKPKFSPPSVKKNSGKEAAPSLKNLKEEYRELITRLREAVQWAITQPKEEVSPHIYALCHLFYTKVDLNAACHDMIKSFRPSEKVKEHPPSNPHFLIRDIDAINRSIASATAFKQAKVGKAKALANSFVGHCNGINIGLAKVSFDSNLDGNPVHVIQQLTIHHKGKTRTVSNIAMGTPTIEKGRGKANIAPEYLGFQCSNALQDKKSLYVHFQKLKKSMMTRIRGGDETARSQAILSLEEKEQLKNHFFLLVLSKNSPFYKQDPNGEGVPEAADQFKNKFINQLFEMEKTESGNYISPEIEKKLNLKDLSLEKWTKKLNEEIHQVVFKGCSILNAEQKKCWIELIHFYLTFLVLLELEIDDLQMLCKDGGDRGAVATQFFSMNLAIINGKEDSPEAKQFLETFLFVRALMIRDRELHAKKKKRFEEVAPTLLNHKEQLRTLYRHLFPETTVTSTGFTSSQMDSKT